MLDYDVATNPINNIEWLFPLLECFHISMFTMSIGLIALVDLRMLGLGLGKATPAQLTRDTMFWTIAGLFIVITSGMLIFTSDPVRYYYNPTFRFKLLCLLVAIIYNYTIHRKVALSNPSRGVGSVTAIVSLLLWVAVVFGGLLYAFL
jgi:hypothetical protein